MNIDLALIDAIILQLPNYVFVKDKDLVYRLCNLNFAKSVGVSHPQEVVGKTDYDMPWGKYTADSYLEEDKAILKTGKPMPNTEVKMVTPEGEKILSVSKAPLYDKDSKVIGILGIYIDMTPHKEAEELRLENEVHKELLQQHKEYLKNIDKFVHDVQSPVTGGLMMVNKCTELPEEKRVPLRVTLMQIQDMARNLLNKYNKKEDESASLSEQRQPVLVSAVLSDVLILKKYEYEGRPITFEHDFKQHFAFVSIEFNGFKRMISNIINNAVDAFDKKAGKIILKLDATKEWVTITVEDNGKGMPPEIVDKVMNNITVTHGKEDGHGIGLMQVREILQNNHGELKIDSKVGSGTKIILTFPRIIAPSWIAEEIKVGVEDIVVVLDDEDSIAVAWKAHFEATLKEAPGIKMHYFKMGKDALNFINGLSPMDKKKVFLLTDYELLGQELNGLSVVEQSKVERAILATSHYTNKEVREYAARVGAKILPKQLAPDVAIKIDANIKYEVPALGELKKVDLIMVDDNKIFADSVALICFSDKVVEQFEDPLHFLKNVSQYPKDTKICLDNNFESGGLCGMDIAKQLHEQGYTRLYMLSGDRFDDDQIPSYLTVILKSDMDSIKKI